MCTQYYIVYTCVHTKQASLEACASPVATCHLKNLESLKYLYVNQKCDACRRTSEKEWRLKKQIAWMERQEKRKEVIELRKVEERMLVDEVFREETLAARRKEKQRERDEEIERLEAFGRRKQRDDGWKQAQINREEEHGVFVPGRGVMGGLGIFFGM